MNVSRLHASLLAAAIFAMAVPAWAATKYILTGSITTTQYVGDASATMRRTLKPGGDYQGLYEITLWEKNDVPMRIRARARHLNTYRTKAADYSPTGSGKSAKTASFNDQDTYIHGVRLCMNKSGKKIKGMQLYGKKLNRKTGTLSNAGSRKWELPNCKNWGPTRYCPHGQIATGLEIKHGINYIGGFKLQCRKVARK